MDKIASGGFDKGGGRTMASAEREPKGLWGSACLSISAQ